jgi:hypothetical protein
MLSSDITGLKDRSDLAHLAKALAVDLSESDARANFKNLIFDSLGLLLLLLFVFVMLIVNVFLFRVYRVD